jgi:hypothetical protein
MEKKITLKVASIVLAVAVLFSACASSTLIQSYPSGAKVYIDGQQVGVTPYWYSDTKIMGSVTGVDIIKEGYEPIYTTIERNERLDVGALIGGFCLWIPFLWTMQYQPAHSYELYPLPLPKQNVVVQEPAKAIEAQVQLTEKSQVEAILPKLQKLRELKQMLDEKLITKEDFDKQKQKILDEK